MSGTALAVSGLAVGGLTQLVGSSMTMKSAYAEAEALREYGDMQYYDSLMEAYQTETEAKQYKENQTMKYVMSGVSLQGTPMQMLDYTSAQSQMEIEHLKSRGQKLREQAYTKAAYTESSARGKMLSSLASTAFSLGAGAKALSEGGMFNITESTTIDKVANSWNTLLGNSKKSTIEYGYMGNLSGIS